MYQKLKEQFRKENSIIRTVKNKDNPYVMINKQGVQDPNLSWAAKGLLAYLLSLPDDWTIYAKELLKHTSSGETNTYTVIRELLRHGYMEKIEYRYKGKILALNYTVFEVPVDVTKTDTSKPRIVKVNDDGEYDETVENTTNEPYWENPNAVKPHEVFTELLINDFNNKDFNNKDFDVDDDAEKLIEIYKSLKLEKRVMPHTLKLIRENAHSFSKEVWDEIFILVSEDNVTSKFKYMRKLVNDFKENNIVTIKDLDRYNAKYKESKANKSKQRDSRPKTRFHNINDRTQNYTPEQLEALLLANQRRKEERKNSFDNFTPTYDKYTEDELNEHINASQRAKFGKDQATPESPSDFVVTKEIYNAILMDPSNYTLAQQRKALEFARKNNYLFIPEYLTCLED
jgi:hypothetical protein